ncbi:hypothetical protein FRC09_013350 [Ceratobasidium sp. 395]|nr:hypothetical protein FRC09_013350 [Ceratobasidium sp. 395]
MSGDDLDDGLVLEPAFHNDSDAASLHELDDEKTIAVEPTPVAGKKRKRAQKPPAEPKAKKPKPPPQNAPTRHISMCQSPAALAQLLERALIKAFPKLSDLEREELVLPGPFFFATHPSPSKSTCQLSLVLRGHYRFHPLVQPALVDTTQFTTERTHATLPDFISASPSRSTLRWNFVSTHLLLISAACPNLAARIAQRPKHHGAPTALVAAGAALRVADLTRTLRPLKGESGGEIAKLFAKHFKLKDHVAYLAKTRVGVAVGTPARLSQLLAEPDALSVKALSHIVLDMSHLDSKQRSLLDIPETRADTLKGVLGNERIRERLANGKTKLVLF